MKINTPHSARPARYSDEDGPHPSAKHRRRRRRHEASAGRWLRMLGAVQRGDILLTENGKRRKERASL
jgi:hypothetical protein